jgi:hypothetical protein
MAVFIPILGICGLVGFVALKMWFDHQLKMREAPGGDIDALTEAVQQLHDEVGSMREDFTELLERVDFTERMLSEVRSRNAIGPGDST